MEYLFLNKKWFFIVGMVLGISISTGHSKERLIYAETSEPLTLNPLNMVDMPSFRFSSLLYNSLLGVDVNMIPVPEILTSLEPEISPDGKSYIFYLRKDIKWHDGKPFTAKDIEFTFKVLRNPRTSTNLKGVNEYIKDVKVVDSHTIKFILRRRLPKEILLGKLTIPIIPKHLFADGRDYIVEDDPFGFSKVVGTGPYRFDKWAKGRAIRLFRNESYFKGWRKLKRDEKRIDEIIMQVMRDPVAAKDALIFGGVHLLCVVSPVHYEELRASPEVELVKYNWRGFSYFAFNCGRGFLKNKKVREALTYGIDREAMLRKVFGEEYVGKGYILSGPYPLGEGDPKIKPRAYDLNKAKKLLKECGFKDSDGDGILERDGVPFVISLKTFLKDETHRRICTLFQAQLLKLGIKLRNDQIDFMEKKRWIKEVIKERDFDIAYGIWTFSPDADIVEDLFSSSAMRVGGNNFVSYSNQAVDSILMINKRILDPDARRANKYKLHRIIHEDCPYIFLFSLPHYAAIRSAVLKGVEIHPYKFFAFITDWYMVEAF